MDATKLTALAEQVAARLHGRSVATAESCTAGRIAERLAAVTSATDFLRGGLVAYQEGTKRDLLGVRATSVLSKEAAAQMADGACRLFGAEAAVATSGVAGDEEVDGVAPGTVFIATAVGGTTSARTYRWDGDPEAVCAAAAAQALRDLADALAETRIRLSPTAGTQP